MVAQNASSRICTLPGEILAKILADVVYPDRDYESTSWQDHVELTTVCKKWHALLSNYPDFWATIPLLPGRRTAKLMARSKVRPLVVRLDLREYADSDLDFSRAALLRLLSSVTGRLAELHIRIPHEGRLNGQKVTDCC